VRWSWWVSPTTFRRVALGAVAALSAIVVSGGAVRLTASGLGCPDWPTCKGRQVVAAWAFHPMVEFGNRVVVTVVSVGVVLVVLAALARRPRRPDLVWLSVGLVVGVIAQVVLGGVVVLLKLAPPLVMAHFLLSLAVLGDAVVLHRRAGLPDTVPRPVVGLDLVRLSRLILAMVVVVVTLGTAVTGSGPHAGDIHAKRLAISFHGIAEVHSTAVMLLIGLTLASLFALHQAGAPAGVQRRGRILLEVMAAQAVVGYTQYFTRVPALLVGIHIAGATAVWVTALRFHLGLFVRPTPTPVAATAVPEVVAEDLLVQRCVEPETLATRHN